MDWDQAYDNRGHVPDAASFPPRWQEEAEAFRAAIDDRWQRLTYGPSPRHWADLFRPKGTAKGLAVFVHGGYWMRFDAGVFSHLAAGALDHGWAVAMPCYPVAPDARIPEITGSITRALETLAAEVDGPIRLAGHSAGGHLVTRQLCADTHLSSATIGRIVTCLSISGVHDLRPLMFTEMSSALGLDDDTARRESPALHEPAHGVHAALTCYVGGAELPEFRRQNALLANIWKGLGIVSHAVEQPGRNHFTVIEPLADGDSGITRAWIE